MSTKVETKTVKVEKELTPNQVMQVSKNELKAELQAGVIKMLEDNPAYEVIVGGANYPGGKKDSVIIHNLETGISAKVDFTAPRAGTPLYVEKEVEEDE